MTQTKLEIDQVLENISVTLSSLSTAEQMARNLSSGTPHTENRPSNSCLWFSCHTHTYRAKH